MRVPQRLWIRDTLSRVFITSLKYTHSIAVTLVRNRFGTKTLYPLFR